MHAKLAAFLFALALTLGAIAWAGAEQAQACSCVARTSKTLREFLRTSDGAFVGRLERAEPDAAGARGTFHFRVERRYKGRLGRRVAVRANLGDASCGLGDLPVGKRVGVFLDRRGRRYESNICKVVTPAQMRRAARGSAAAAGRCPTFRE